MQQIQSSIIHSFLHMLNDVTETYLLDLSDILILYVLHNKLFLHNIAK